MANKTVYQTEHTICPGSTYCEAGIIEIKQRMIIRLIREIPIEDLEKLFQIKTKKRPEGQNINIKIEL